MALVPREYLAHSYYGPSAKGIAGTLLYYDPRAKGIAGTLLYYCPSPKGIAGTLLYYGLVPME